MPGLGLVLFGALFTVASCWAAGGIVLRRMRLAPVEGALLEGAVGASVLSLAVLALSLLHLAYPVVFAVVGAGTLATRWRLGVRRGGELPFWELTFLWTALFGVVFGVYALLYLSVSLAPEHSPDGQTYHLGLVYRFFREHGMGPITSTMYAPMPLATEMLFLFAFAFGRNAAAATVHLGSLFALFGLVVCYGRRIGRPWAGVCAGLLVFLSPIAGIDAASAYNDVALTTAAFAMFYLVEVWRDGDDSALVPTGLLAGFCFAIKYTGFVAFLYAAVVILWLRRPRALLPVTLAAGLVALPWVVKNWIWYGNPVAPLLNRVFENPYVHVANEEAFRAYFRHYTLSSLWQVPWAVTVTGETGGQLGLVFLLAPLGLLALRGAVGRRVLVVAAIFLIPYPLNIGTRFLLPALPFVALAMVMACGRLRVLQVGLVLVAAVTAWPKVTARMEKPGNMRVTGFDWKAAVGVESPEGFLRRRSLEWRVAQMLESHVPPDKRIWSSQPLAESYLQSNILVSYLSGEGELIRDIISNAASDPDREPTWNLRFDFRPQSIQHLRVTQSAHSLTDTWSIGELYLFRAGREVPPTPRWHVDAAPYPWDAALAFDRNPATRWMTWRSIEPGMHFDILTDRPVELDSVEIRCARDQWKIELRLESCDGGDCKVIAGKPRTSVLPPIGDFRLAAMKAVRAHGIDFLLIDKDDPNAADIAVNPARWGLVFIAEAEGRRLYRT